MFLIKKKLFAFKMTAPVNGSRPRNVGHSVGRLGSENSGTGEGRGEGGRDGGHSFRPSLANQGWHRGRHRLSLPSLATFHTAGGGGKSGLVTISIIFCRIFTSKEKCDKGIFPFPLFSNIRVFYPR